MPSNHLRPFLTAEDAPGQKVVIDGVEYVADESGTSPAMRRALAERDRVSDAIGAEMLDACLATSPYGNPYKR